MEAISVLDNRRHYREEQREIHTDGEDQSSATNNIEVLEELTHNLLKEIALLKGSRKSPSLDAVPPLSLPDKVRRFEIELICRTLLRTGGHQARAAQLLGVNATTLNSKLKRYRISPQTLLANRDDASFNNGDDKE